jgi:hypothetical protein
MPTTVYCTFVALAALMSSMALTLPAVIFGVAALTMAAHAELRWVADQFRLTPSTATPEG